MHREDDLAEIFGQLKTGLDAPKPENSRASVLVPLVAGENGPEILFEVRAAHLKRQPNEVCLPGGHIEPGESARDAAIRETCEELLVKPEQLTNVLDLGTIDGPGGMPLHLFAGILAGYSGSFDAEEVGSTLTVPLAWFQEHEPTVYRGNLVLDPPENMPWELVPGGRNYPWRKRVHEIPFYLETSPVIWGFTARVIKRSIECLNAGRGRGRLNLGSSMETRKIPHIADIISISDNRPSELTVSKG